jgi:hypothetical protein
MCGIAGYFGLEASPGLLDRMADEQRHRGPDDAGIFIDSMTGLAHQRLSIIDLEGGSQPMASADGCSVLAYNGEVYSYRELRAELEALSRTFRTESDTEVVLQAFAEWGPVAFDRFNGMFALAIWEVVPGEMVTLSAAGFERRMFSGLREDLLNAESPAEGYDSGMATDFAIKDGWNKRVLRDATDGVRWLSGSSDLDSMVFWRLINIELWLREFFDGAAADPVASDTEAA